jgi:ATP-dependent exoDNAse (exonuclease V) beta subunit
LRRGRWFHDFAERYALGEDVTPSNEHEERVRRFIDGLEGELYVEEGITPPVTVDGDRYTVSGVADLVHVLGDSAEIVDYKTDQTRRAHDEYRKQASVYYHVVADAFPDKEVSASLFYTEDDEVVTVEPLSLGELKRLVREA